MKLLKYFIAAFVIIFYTNGQEPVFKVYKIWDYAPHNAFTDLIEYDNNFYCTFREGDGHVPGSNNCDGKIRILISKNSEKWKSIALLKKDGYDLRDSKLSITPKGELMVLMGGSDYDDKTHALNGRLTHVSFYDKKHKRFSEPQPVQIDSKIKSNWDWLWRVTWHKNIGYGVMYRKKDKTKSEAFLLKTMDGLHYDLICPLNIQGLPGEATVVFDNKDIMNILLRRDGKTDNRGIIGQSNYPYDNWSWTFLDERLGGPNIIYYSDSTFFVGSRSYNIENIARTSIFSYKYDGKLKHLIELPSGGDTSYPGMLLIKKILYVSYYSTHEGKTAIYIAQIPLCYLN